MVAVYDETNIFARILRGELPCHKVFEDDVALAFLDIMPRGDGHTLVIPKVTARNLLDIAPADLGALMARVQQVARGVVTALAAEGFTLQQFNESAGGQQVFHLHFHILPRWAGIELRPPSTLVAPSETLVEQREKIIAALR